MFFPFYDSRKEIRIQKNLRESIKKVLDIVVINT